MAVGANAYSAPRGGANTERKYFPYDEVILQKRSIRAQVVRIHTVVDNLYGEPRYGKLKTQVDVIVLVPGAEKVVKGDNPEATAEKQEAFRRKGHGKRLSMRFNPVTSEARPNPSGKGTLSASSQYEFIRLALNDGEPLSDAQLGKDKTDKELKEWGKFYNEVMAGDEEAIARYIEEYPFAPVPRLKENDDDDEGQLPIDLSSKNELRYRYVGMRTAQCLNEIEHNQPQVWVTPDVKIRQSDHPEGKYKKGDKNNKLSNIDGLVTEEERVPAWEPFQRPYDPREEADEEVFCEETGERIRGFAKRDGTWVSAQDVAKWSIEHYGKVLGWKARQERKDQGEHDEDED